jgi:parvulin-like peptidyl-prolyl isomerase
MGRLLVCICRTIIKGSGIWLSAILLGFFAVEAVSQGTPVIVVNKVTITKERIDSLVALLAKHQFPGRVLNKEEHNYLEQLVAGNLVGQELLILESKAQNIKISKEEADSLMSTFRYSFQSNEDYQEAMRRVGDSEKSLREKLEKELKIEKLLLNHLKPLSRPSEEQMKAYFAKHKAKLPVNDALRASQIVLKISKKEVAKKIEEKRQFLDKIRSQLLEVAHLDLLIEKFAGLAFKHSESEDAQAGGDLNRFQKGDFFPAFDKEIKDLKVGQLSKVFRSPMGLHLVLLTEKNDGKYENYRIILMQLMVAEQTRDNQIALENYLKTLMNKYNVKYLNNRYKGALSVDLKNKAP